MREREKDRDWKGDRDTESVTDLDQWSEMFFWVTFNHFWHKRIEKRKREREREEKVCVISVEGSGQG